MKSPERGDGDCQGDNEEFEPCNPEPCEVCLIDGVEYLTNEEINKTLCRKWLVSFLLLINEFCVT